MLAATVLAHTYILTNTSGRLFFGPSWCAIEPLTVWAAICRNTGETKHARTLQQQMFVLVYIRHDLMMPPSLLTLQKDAFMHLSPHITYSFVLCLPAEESLSKFLIITNKHELFWYQLSIRVSLAGRQAELSTGREYISFCPRTFYNFLCICVCMCVFFISFLLIRNFIAPGSMKLTQKGATGKSKVRHFGVFCPTDERNSNLSNQHTTEDAMLTLMVVTRRPLV